MRTLVSIKLTALFLVSVASTVVTSAQNSTPTRNVNQAPLHYKLVDLGTFGGRASQVNPPWSLGAPNQMNSHGVTVGLAATPVPTPLGCFFCDGLDGQVQNVFHAFKWSGGAMEDLGALPGELTNSAATSVNSNGIAVGYSENGETDPLTGGREFRAVLWRDGRIINLGTFGGTESAATMVNDRDQAIGLALNTIPDPYSYLGLLLLQSTNLTQMRGFLWENGHKRDLGTLGGPDTFVQMLNNLGEVVGGSYVSAIPNPGTGVPTSDPFLWRNGKMIDLGNLGGTMSAASAINNRSQIIGTSNLQGDQENHPFLWRNGKMIDLNTTSIGGQPRTVFAINDSGEIIGGGTFPNRPYDAYVWKDGKAIDLGVLDGDCFSEAEIINAQGVISGLSFSCDGQGRRPFLWQNGHLYYLSQLARSTSGAQFTQPFVINDRGEIGGVGAPIGCADDEDCGHAFVLMPSNARSADFVENGESQTSHTGAANSANTSLNPAMGAAALPRDVELWIRSRVAVASRIPFFRH